MKELESPEGDVSRERMGEGRPNWRRGLRTFPSIVIAVLVTCFWCDLELLLTLESA